MEYFLISGWICSILFSLIICIKAFIDRSESSFGTGVILLICSILVGHLVFYPFVIAVLLVSRFAK